MDVKFQDPGAVRMAESVLLFQHDGESEFWLEPLYHFYPQIDRELMRSLPARQRAERIGSIIRSIYESQQTLIGQKIDAYQQHWNSHRAEIEAAFSDSFELDCRRILNDLVCHVSLNPISPRFLREHLFEIFYLNSPQGAMGTALHEITHFVWFYKWNGLFGDSYDEYERPSLKWILSEMVVEAVLRDPRLSSLDPYFPRSEGGCIYPYFFSMTVGGAPVLDIIDALYADNGIEDFMRKAYRLCVENEAEIRAHILQSEQ